MLLLLLLLHKKWLLKSTRGDDFGTFRMSEQAPLGIKQCSDAMIREPVRVVQLKRGPRSKEAKK